MAWLAPDRIVAVAWNCCTEDPMADLVVVDPLSRRLVERRPLRAHVIRAVRSGDRLVVLAGKQGSRRRQAVVIDSNGTVREGVLERIAAGVERIGEEPPGLAVTYHVLARARRLPGRPAQELPAKPRGGGSTTERRGGGGRGERDSRPSTPTQAPGSPRPLGLELVRPEQLDVADGRSERRLLRRYGERTPGDREPLRLRQEIAAQLLRLEDVHV